MDNQLAARLRRTCDLRPTAAAVRTGTHTLTYGELGVAAGLLAEALVDGPGVRGCSVGVLLPRGPGFVVAAAAALQAGGAYLPLDPSWPAGRLARVLASARPAAVVTADGVDAPAGWRVGTGVAVDGERVTVNRSDTAPAQLPVSAMYVMYTSGSTGAPKGVVVGHAGLVRLLDRLEDLAPLHPGAAHSWWTAPGFDVSVYEMWAALGRGAALVVVPDSVRVDAAATLALFHAEDVGGAFLPRQFLAPLAAHLARGTLPTLERLLVGVEPIPLGVLQDVLAAAPALAIVNGYGLTETTVCASLHRVPRLDVRPGPGSRAPIGTAVPGSRIELLGPDGVAVLPGVAGEVVVTGDAVALAQITESGTVTALPAHGRLPHRTYRTGDLAVADGAGTLTFTGRLDDQVKVSGVRVSPAEVEGVLAGCRAVEDVRVLPKGDHGLAAYLVLHDGSTLAEVRAHLDDELPTETRPRHLVVVEAIPHTPDGKLDRGALPPPDRVGSPPRTGAEQLVADQWQAVLPGVRVHRESGFVELGGDSLLAALAAAGLRPHLQRPVTATEILSAPTLAHLAARLGEVASPTRRTPTGGGGQTVGRLSWGQEGLVLAEATCRQPARYHEPVLLEVSGTPDAVDPERLGAAFRTAAAGHPAFGSAFDLRRLRVHLGAHPQPTAQVDDLSGAADRERAWAGLVARTQQPSFDLQRAAPVRYALARMSPGTTRIAIVAHHLVTDSWSTRLLLADAAAILRGHPGSTTGAYTYCDWAEEQRAAMGEPEASVVLEAAAEAVAQALGLGPPAAPAPAPPGLLEFIVPGATWRAARAAAGASGARAALLSAVCRAGATAGLPPIRIGVASAGRAEARTHDLAGFFVTTVLPDLTVSGAVDVDRARRALDAVRHVMDLPLPALADAVARRLDRRVSYDELCPMAVSYDAAVSDAFAVEGADVRRLPAVLPQPKAPVTVHAWESRDGRLGVTLQWRDQWAAGVAHRLRAELAATIAQDAGTPVLRAADDVGAAR